MGVTVRKLTCRNTNKIQPCISGKRWTNSEEYVIYSRSRIVLNEVLGMGSHGNAHATSQHRNDKCLFCRYNSYRLVDLLEKSNSRIAYTLRISEMKSGRI
jgi:hypothetical protein